METKKYRFDEVTINFDKKRIPLSSAQREKRQGMFRYYGAQGVIDHVDDYIFEGTYLLIAEDGENLKSKKQNIAQVVDGQFWVNNHAHIVQGNEQCDTRFLCYLINSMDLSGYITGSAQPKLSQANLNAVTLSLPTLAEQKRIVEYLYMLDQKIDVNRQINDNLEQQAKTLYKFWFTDYEPFDGVCPADWISGTIDDLAKEVVCGKTPSTKVKEYYGSDVPFITIPDMHGNTYAVTTERYLSNYGAASQPKKTLPPNSICVSCIGTAGLVILVASESQTNQQINSIIPKDEYSPFYIYLLMQTLSEVINKLGQSGSTIVNLNKAQFGKIKVIIPSITDIKTFDELVSPLFALILENQKENIRLSSIRETLLPKLMSGELDVSDLDL